MPNITEQISKALDPENLDPNNFCNSGLKVHPIAAIFPMIEGKEFDQMCLDIQSNGLQVPITVLDGVLLDGRNRLKACAKFGIAPTFAEYTGRRGSEDEWIISLNVHRRSLTPDQRAALVAKYYDWKDAEERARQARVAAGEATQKKAKGQVPQNRGGPQKSKNPVRDDIAKKAGIGGGKAEQAIGVAKKKPELLDDVVKGKVKLRDAAKKIADELGTTEHNVRRLAAQKAAPELFERVARGEITLKDAVKMAKQKAPRPPQAEPPQFDLENVVAKFRQAMEVVLAACPAKLRPSLLAAFREVLDEADCTSALPASGSPAPRAGRATPGSGSAEAEHVQAKQ